MPRAIGSPSPFCTSSRPLSPSYVIGNRGYFAVSKRPESETVHLCPYSTEVKNYWSHNSISRYALLVCCLMRHSEKFGLFLAAERSLITPGPDDGRTDRRNLLHGPSLPLLQGRIDFCYIITQCRD